MWFNEVIPLNEYVSGNAFQSMADFTYVCGQPIPTKRGDGRAVVIFVATHELPELLKAIRLASPCRYVVISHNSDCGIVAGTPRHKSVLYSDNTRNDIEWRYIPENIVHMFAQNVDVCDKRLTPIPIGFENRQYFPNLRKREKIDSLARLVNNGAPRRNLCCMAHNAFTNMEERFEPYIRFGNKPWCETKPGFNVSADFDAYIALMSRSHFMICPDGNGIDCVRVWEALTLGCIPIVKRHVCYEAFSSTVPIVIVDYWPGAELFDLSEKFRLLKNINYSFDFMRASYWKQQIEQAAA